MRTADSEVGLEESKDKQMLERCRTADERSDVENPLPMIISMDWEQGAVEMLVSEWICMGLHGKGH